MSTAIETTTEPTMSSREIAELTGKLHHNVKRDIFTMLDTLKINAINFECIYRDDRNRKQMEYRLNRYYTELLITGYDVKRRAAVIDRWFELEKQVSQPQVPQSFAEALRLAADTQEQLEQEQKEKEQAQKRVSTYEKVTSQHNHTLHRVVRTFPGVNTMKIKSDLMFYGYLYKRANTYKVRAKYSHLFTERTDDGEQGHLRRVETGMIHPLSNRP